MIKFRFIQFIITEVPILTFLYRFLQRNESELEGMAVASVVGDDSTNPASPNPEENDGKEASGKKKKNRCLNCKKKVGLTGMKKKYQNISFRNLEQTLI